MSPEANGNTYNWNFKATLGNVEQVCAAVAHILDKFFIGKKDRFAVELLLHEALNNAVIHGSRGNAKLSVTLQLFISEKALLMAITDMGSGFDWHTQRALSPDHAAESGRGLYIYRMYAHAIQFNAAGNSVTLTRIFNRGEKDE